uniref:Uncharacterized protein LOC104221912 n=1 Tax=Nicotiana sylvestris TaxID=4096 RepID=A0A1U7VYB8_NICSY|nr:PREDICTED: uncharacterized protein LOC104221912 [Nicotiana sylvestris]
MRKSNVKLLISKDQQPRKIYANAYDVKVWRVIKKESYPLPAAAQPLADPKDIDSYTDEQIAVVQVNNKARNLFYNAISGEEYEKISSCDTTKEMWDKIEVTYKGTNKVKETHINMLVPDEVFQMKEGKSIEEMFSRFSKIISDLKYFGKPYSSGDQVRKILRSLPTTWKTKVVTLESHDLNKLSYDELRGELIAFKKTHLKKTNQEEKKKTVAFKATIEIPENDIDDDPKALQEEIAMVSRNMDGLMRKFKNARRETMPLRGFNKNKSFGSWSDENSSEHEEIPNLCFMTIMENDMNKLLGCRTDEDTSDNECKDDNDNCFMARGETSEVRSYNSERCNELQDILDLTLTESQKMMNELKKLNKEVKDWKLKHEVCEIEKEVLQKSLRNCKCNSMACVNPPVIVLSGQTRRLTSQVEKDQPEQSPLVLILMKDPKMDQELCITTVTKVDIDIPFVDFEHHRRIHKGKWYLDSACSSHMTGDKNLFKEVTKIDGGSVKFGDDSKGKIVGSGTIPFNNNCDITEIYLVDGLNYNLLSISQL